MSVIVIQMGARRGYAIPAAFAASGKLQSLYTDLAGSHGLGRAASMLAKLPIPQRLQAPISRLGGRLPPPEVVPFTHTFDRQAGPYELAMQRARTPKAKIEARLAFDDAWSAAMRRRGFGTASHIYTMMSGQTLEGTEFLRAARDRGLEVAVDITIALSTERIIAEEYAANPGWGDAPVTYLGAMGDANPAYRETIALGTRYLCASPFVAEDMIANWGADPKRVRVEPYSFNPAWLDVVNRPVPGRVLFAGSADLRKGIHHFARAAQILRARGRDYQFRVVGNVDAQVRQHPEASELDFVGRLPREAMKREFAAADILALPTLAEGSAGVTYEAMASGVPIVTTRAAGSLVENDIHGAIVEIGSATALADAIERIVEERSTRDAMGSAARARMKTMSWADYGRRLDQAVFGPLGPTVDVAPDSRDSAGTEGGGRN